MHYSYRIEQAIRASAILHKDQVRKGDVPYPYITHTFAVALLVADYTHDEDTLVAALLHDTLEDTDYTKSELNEDFGHGVLEIVETLTVLEEAPDMSWMAKRKQYIQQLKGAHEKALIVATADKIHNMRSMVESYYDTPERITADFGGTLEERVTVYQEISNILNRNLKSDILSEFNHVFEEFKEFILKTQREYEESGF